MYFVCYMYYICKYIYISKLEERKYYYEIVRKRKYTDSTML